MKVNNNIGVIRCKMKGFVLSCACVYRFVADEAVLVVIINAEMKIGYTYTYIYIYIYIYIIFTAER